MSIGDEIKRIRKAKGLTQRQLAKISGISNASISRWESGQNEPTYFDAECLINALGCRLEIVDDSDKTGRPQEIQSRPHSTREL